MRGESEGAVEWNVSRLVSSATFREARRMSEALHQNFVFESYCRAIMSSRNVEVIVKISIDVIVKVNIEHNVKVSVEPSRQHSTSRALSSHSPTKTKQ